jgi:hypothetical protein
MPLPSVPVALHPASKGARWRLSAELAVVVFCLLAALVAGAPRARAAPDLLVQLPGEAAPRLLPADQLAALPQSGFQTSTVWTEGVDRYDGVMLADLLRHLGVDPAAFSGAIVVEALDGYSARIPAALVTGAGPLLALRRNGAPMPVRNQGPIWLLFPFDDDPLLRIESIYALAVWQVRALRIEAGAGDRP